MGNDREKNRPDSIERVTNGVLTALVAVALITGIIPVIVSQILGLSTIEGWAGLQGFQSFMFLLPIVLAIGAIAVIIRQFTSSRE